MIIYALIISVVIILIILTFTSKTLSPIPYFPSQKVDLPLIIKSLDLNNGQVIFDLGAGDGIVIFTAAKEAFKKKLNAKFIAVEINPILVLLLQFRHLFHPNRHNIKIIWDDFFKMNFKLFTFNFSLLTFYLYISPWFLDRVSKKIRKKFPKTSIVSYMYPIKSLKKKEKIIRGKNEVFIYS